MVPNKDKVYLVFDHGVFHIPCVPVVWAYDMIRMIRIHGVKKALTHISVKLVSYAVSKWRGIYHAYQKVLSTKKNSVKYFLILFLKYYKCNVIN